MQTDEYDQVLSLEYNGCYIIGRGEQVEAYTSSIDHTVKFLIRIQIEKYKLMNMIECSLRNIMDAILLEMVNK